MEDLLKTMDIEVVDGEIVMYFGVRDAEEPEACERLLGAFEGARVLLEKEFDTGEVILCISGSDAIRGSW
ncbi:MAG: hypothetical protein M3518_04340 [Actinomycetota bacterium]|nr:hypothetical protein [Actinomycetota bacterium]